MDRGQIAFLSQNAADVFAPLEKLPEAGEFGFRRHDPDRLEAMRASVEIGIAIGMERLDGEDMARFPSLRLLALVGAGTDGVDLDAARARGIAVTSTAGSNAVDVAEFAFAQWLACRRGLLAGDRAVRTGAWLARRERPRHAAYADRIGIAGMGAIGGELARRAAAWGCEVRWWSRSARPDAPWPREASLTALAQWADTLFIALPGGADTHHLVDVGVIAALGPGGLLVNVGRGGIVDTAALASALRDGSLGGAALDVFEQEPFDGAGLADLDTILMSPHIAGATLESRDRVRTMVFESIRSYCAGERIRHRIV